MLVEIGSVSFKIQLSSFRLESNNKYTLLDTGCVLELLPKTQSFFYTLEKKELKIAILQKTISEVAEHLIKSIQSRQNDNMPSFDIINAANNLKKILMDERIRKISNPVMNDKKISNYENYAEDKILAYALFEGKFRAISTKDKPFSTRLREKYMPLNKVLNP